MPTTLRRCVGPSASQTVFPSLYRLLRKSAPSRSSTGTGEIGEQHAVNKVVPWGSRVDYNRRLAHFAGPGDDFGDGFV